MALISPLIPTYKGVYAGSPDGVSIALFHAEDSVVVRDTMTLRIQYSFHSDTAAKKILFSPDSAYLACLVESQPDFINIYDLKTHHIMDRVSADVNFGIISMVWLPDSKALLYFSRDGIYIGVYRLESKRSMYIRGGKLDDFDRPLFCFSTDGELFSLVRNQMLFTYDTKTWKLLPVAVQCIVNPKGVVYVDPVSVLIWNGGSKFRVNSVAEGRLIHEEDLFPEGNVKTYALPYHCRIIALVTSYSKVLIYDTISWERIIELEQKYCINRKECKIVEKESDIPPSFGNLEFIQKELQLVMDVPKWKRVENPYELFKMSVNKKYFASFDKDGRILATYDPTVPYRVWIWNLTLNLPLSTIICLREDTDSIKGLNWDCKKGRLGIVLRDRILFWGDSCTSFGIYCKSWPLKFSWSTRHHLAYISSPRHTVVVQIHHSLKTQ